MKKNSFNFKNLAKGWAIPFVVAIALFIVVKPAIAQVVGEDKLSQFLSGGGSVEVGTETVEGRSRVYYFFEGDKKYISSKSENSKQPFTRGSYIVWSTETAGGGQIFLYHIPSGGTVELGSPNILNLNPRVSPEGKVVWEGWVGDGWRVLLFDGVSVKQLTESEISLNPDIEGNKVVYGTRDAVGEWRAVYYSIDTGKSYDISFGENTKYPHLKNGKIVFGAGKEEVEFALTPEDIELLEFKSVPTPTATESAEPTVSPSEPTPVTVEQVTQELEATPSATLTPSP